jgi:hypothetical protein
VDYETRAGGADERAWRPAILASYVASLALGGSHPVEVEKLRAATTAVMALIVSALFRCGARPGLVPL